MNLTCPLCKGESKILFPGKILLDRHCNVFSCSACGLVFLNKGTYEDDVLRDDSYWRWKNQEEVYLEEDIQKEFYKDFISYFSQIERYAKGKKLLDVGCGIGIFLKVARDRNWDCFGMDISPKAVEFAKRRLDLPIQVGTLEEGIFINEKFDVITMWDVIEHLYDPARTLREIYLRLNKGGILVIRTINEDFLFRKIAKKVFKVTFGLINFLPKYFYYQDHLFYFSSRVLSNLLKISGPFEIIEIQHTSTGLSFLKKKLILSYAHKSKFLYKMIPLIFRLVSLIGVKNKMVIYARKL